MHDELHEEGGHRGGAWKVAYADFVTALMALFIVLWLLNAGAEVRQSISGYFRDPRGSRGLTGSGHAGMGESLAVDQKNVRHLRSRLEEAMRHLPGFQKFSKYVQFTVTSEGLRIELLENEGGLFFDSGSPRPTDKGEQVLVLLAREIGEFANGVAIEGHTDSRAFKAQSADSYGNWELSFDRANMARRLMLAHGVKPEQITEIRGYADRRMIYPESPEDSRNRRVSVVIKYNGM